MHLSSAIPLGGDFVKDPVEVRNFPLFKDGAYYRSIFARFVTMLEKLSARAIGIQTENWGLIIK